MAWSQLLLRVSCHVSVKGPLIRLYMRSLDLSSNGEELSFDPGSNVLSEAVLRAALTGRSLSTPRAHLRAYSSSSVLFFGRFLGATEARCGNTGS